jgi:hypothetical protein
MGHQMLLELGQELFRRFPEKVIPLYSAVYDDYAIKGQNEVGNTK